MAIVLLPWAVTPFNRCRAVMEYQPHRLYFGRCDLKKHDTDIDHALERGMEVVRWSTRETNATGT